MLETDCEGKVAEAEMELRNHFSETLTAAKNESASAIREPGTAKDSALVAGSAAQTAKEESDKAALTAKGAEQTAGNARKEADSFRGDIVSAKKQAADAELHLGDALQRAANAEKEMNVLRSPQSPERRRKVEWRAIEISRNRIRIQCSSKPRIF